MATVRISLDVTLDGDPSHAVPIAADMAYFLRENYKRISPRERATIEPAPEPVEVMDDTPPVPPRGKPCPACGTSTGTHWHDWCPSDWPGK